RASKIPHRDDRLGRDLHQCVGLHVAEFGFGRAVGIESPAEQALELLRKRLARGLRRCLERGLGIRPQPTTEYCGFAAKRPFGCRSSLAHPSLPKLSYTVMATGYYTVNGAGRRCITIQRVKNEQTHPQSAFLR